jgi:HAD superfamily hydrolase (TIGR01459 family)
MHFLSGLAEVCGDYDALILDLWGVLHNGHAAYPGAVACLEAWKRAGKQVCLLSNAPRRPVGVINRLAALGIERGLYDHIMTSGEAAYQALRDRQEPWNEALGNRVLHIGPPRDNDVFAGLPFVEVNDAAQADFIINTGPVDFAEKMEDFEEVLQAGAALERPMLCANPDLLVRVGEDLVICGGMLAQRYEALGGTVFYYGKPYGGVYRSCLDLLGHTGRVLAVGDSLHTDIAGAAAAGLDAALIIGGIHLEEFGMPWGEMPTAEQVHKTLNAAPHTPKYLLSSFRWDANFTAESKKGGVR